VSEEVLALDGSYGEGGGQILRTSIGLAAALWGQAGRAHPAGLRIFNIRANRPKPGLRAQHLAAVQAAAAVAQAHVQGAAVDSTSLTFRPGRPRAGQYRFDIGTAGSATLVLQTILPALLSAEADSQVVITGGTHNPWAPCFEYLRDVFSTLAEAANVSLAVQLERAGFYPAGGGRIRCAIRGLGGPEQVGPLRMRSRGELRRIEGLSAASESLPEHIVERQRARVAGRLAGAGLTGDVEQARWPTDSPGTVVFLRAVFSRSVAGFFALGKRGKPAERVADEAVDELMGFLAADGAVDGHAADQLITLLALCPRESELTTARVSQHLLTNAEVIRKVAGREVLVEGEMNSPGKVILR
jgi:RNA 3'-terminal phosphate cyclase (ATP)